MLGKLICLMCFVAFVGCSSHESSEESSGHGPGSSEESSGHGPPQCSPRNCPHACPSGYVFDQNGCQTCACLPDPCSGVTCPDCHVCAAVPSNCGTSSCPLVAQCTCQPPNCFGSCSCALGYPSMGTGCLVCGICNMFPQVCDCIQQILP